MNTLKASQAGSACLHEHMTLNRIVREHPETRSVCDRLRISLPFEGCDCLDEVAWRLGIKARDLISQLEGVIASGGYQESNASSRTASASALEEARAEASNDDASRRV